MFFEYSSAAGHGENTNAGSKVWMTLKAVGRADDTFSFDVSSGNTKGYSSTYLAMGFAIVRAGTCYPPEH